MNGFIEVYMDARGIKGAWEGLVYYANPEKTGKIRTLATHAQWFEDHLPVEPRFRKPVVQGVSAMAIEVVIEIGDSGPITPIGVNLPERSAHPRAVRQQVRVPRRTCSRPTRRRSPKASATSSAGTTTRRSGRASGRRLPAS